MYSFSHYLISYYLFTEVTALCTLIETDIKGTCPTWNISI